MSFKQLESDWEKVKKIIISNTVQNPKISEVLKNKTFGCQTEKLIDIFSILLDEKVLDKQSGMCILRDENDDHFLFLEDTTTICFEDGEMNSFDCDMDEYNFVSKEKATELLNSSPMSIILKILSFYEENRKKVDELLKTQKPLSLNQKKSKVMEVMEIIDNCDFEEFYGKVMEHVFNLLKLKSVPKPLKVKDGKRKPVNFGNFVERVYKKIKFDGCDETRMKIQLNAMFESTLESSSVNPFSGYNQDIVGIVSLFRSFTWTDDTIASFSSKGLMFLSQIHPNLSQLVEVNQLVKPIDLFSGQVIKVKYFHYEGEDYENSLFWYNGDGLENNEITIRNQDYLKLDRVFTEYPTLKEMEKFIVEDMNDFWNNGEWEE